MVRTWIKKLARPKSVEAGPVVAETVKPQIEIPTEKIAQRAYELWMARGCPQGADATNWLDAERELREELKRPPEPLPKQSR